MQSIFLILSEAFQVVFSSPVFYHKEQSYLISVHLLSKSQ